MLSREWSKHPSSSRSSWNLSSEQTEAKSVIQAYLEHQRQAWPCKKSITILAAISARVSLSNSLPLVYTVLLARSNYWSPLCARLSRRCLERCSTYNISRYIDNSISPKSDLKRPNFTVGLDIESWISRLSLSSARSTPFEILFLCSRDWSPAHNLRKLLSVFKNNDKLTSGGPRLCHVRPGNYLQST